jgi:hypothetical protein
VALIFHQIMPGIVDARHYLDKAKTVSAWFPGRPMGVRNWIRAILAGRVQAMVSIGPHWHWRTRRIENEFLLAIYLGCFTLYLSKVRLKHLLVCAIVYARAAACDHKARSLWSEVSKDAGMDCGRALAVPD